MAANRESGALSLEAGFRETSRRIEGRTAALQGMNNVFSLQKTFEGKVFTIPDYQRGYAWEEQHLLDLWEDIEFLASGKKHYTGNLVLQRRDGETVQAEDGSRNEVFEIVDGQQRLTTLVILLECLR